MEIWDLKVKGTDLTSYTQRFQELTLLYGRMFPEESDKVEKYIGGLPDMIHGSVVASKPKTMQDAIEMATELMDKKISTFVERQAENKRKLDYNNQAQQQPPKKLGVAITYTAGTGERKEYAGTLPLCNSRRHLIPNPKPRSQDTSLVALGQSAIKLARQKSYANERRKPLEFQVGDRVMLKYHADEPLAVPLDGFHVDDKLYFVEEPVEIMDREVKRLKQSRIPLVKVRWNSKRGPEFTWEREDQFRKKYPHLFSKTAPSSSAAS
ncbi:hypothetical protein Tco_1253725 [Tanacetum coccineum]